MFQKMPIDLYYVPGSAPCRAVLLAAKAIGVDLNLKHLDLMKGEHLTPDFIKVFILIRLFIENCLLMHASRKTPKSSRKQLSVYLLRKKHEW